MTLFDIDFNYWYNKNNELNKSKEDGVRITRHHAVATQIFNAYDKKNLRLAYFTQFEKVENINFECNRIKSLSYEELENEILNYTREIIESGFTNTELILKTFDLIQIWGGRPGGNNIYNKTGHDRLNYSEWLEKYIEGAKKASVGNLDSYQILKSIKHLQLPFASKHVNFFSRHLKMNSLIIIDEKISHCFKIQDPKSISKQDIEEINNLCREKAAEVGFEPWQIEKCLFTFHANYFEAKSLINEAYECISDISSIKEINDWYIKIKKNETEEELRTSTKKKNNKNIEVAAKYFLKKNIECIITKDGYYLIKYSAIEKHKIEKKLINKSNFSTIKGEIFFKYIGNINLIKII